MAVRPAIRPLNPRSKEPIHACGQATTALAETPGSRFTGECEALLRDERYGDLMDKFAQNLDLVLSKATSDQGDASMGGWPGLASHVARRAAHPSCSAIIVLEAKLLFTCCSRS